MVIDLVNVCLHFDFGKLPIGPFQWPGPANVGHPHSQGCAASYPHAKHNEQIMLTNLGAQGGTTKGLALKYSASFVVCGVTECYYQD